MSQVDPWTPITGITAYSWSLIVFPLRHCLIQPMSLSSCDCLWAPLCTAIWLTPSQPSTGQVPVSCQAIFLICLLVCLDGTWGSPESIQLDSAHIPFSILLPGPPVRSLQWGVQRVYAFALLCVGVASRLLSFCFMIIQELRSVASTAATS